jgi:UDPglucose 6-dehydrogenase
MNIVVVGTGYVGLVTGTCFASLDNNVICVDIDEDKIANLKRGKTPIFEPGLPELVTQAIADGTLHFTTDLGSAVAASEVVFLALPTPSGEDGSADLSYVLTVADQLGPLLKRYTVVVDKSTVPVGTAEQVRARIKKHAKQPFDVVSNPEFLREGVAVDDFLEPNRIVIGTGSDQAQELMRTLYEPITKKGHPLYVMDERSAELTKYASNSFLALKISFMNEIANLCELSGADIDNVRIGMGSDERIGNRFLSAGIGYGGSCFPKDVQALWHTAQTHRYNLTLIETIIALNAQQQQRLQQKVLAYFNGNLKNKTLALWGLAFKPNTDDVRQAPALEIIRDLTAQGARIQAYDPEAAATTRRVLGEHSNLQIVDTAFDALKGADALLVATEWDEFKDASLERIKAELKKPVVFDGRNIFLPAVMAEHGFYYESIGRAPVKPAKTAKTAKATSKAADSRIVQGSF